MPRIDPKTLSDERLKNLIQNYKHHNATDRVEYRECIEEHNRRFGGSFDLQKTIDFILSRARARRFSSYGEIAELHGADWSKVRHAMPHHLWDVVRWAHSKGLPMLSAGVVNKQHVETGKMESETLKGFIGAAEQLGYTIDDPHDFLRHQQDKCFAVAIRGEGINEEHQLCSTEWKSEGKKSRDTEP
jgi:hypothetical protein